MKTLSIIIPCYNEEEVLPHLMKRMDLICNNLKKDWDIELLYINDGSEDRTHSILDSYAKTYPYVRVVHHKKNMNLGAAVRTGIKEAKGEVLITNDADCTYPPEEIPLLLAHLTPDVDIVQASHYHPRGGVDNVPFYRLFLSKSVSMMYRFVTRSKMYTFTGLFRAYKADVAKNTRITSNDFLGVAELVIYPLMQGYNIKEYPTVLRTRRFGSSKIKLVKVIKSHLKFILYLATHKKELSKRSINV